MITAVINNKNKIITELNRSVLEKIDEWILKFPKSCKRSATLIALKYAQDFNGGFLNNALITDVASYLEIPRIFVLEVATFYSMYHMDKAAKYKISVCTNITCSQVGSKELVSYLKGRYSIEFGMVSADGKVFLNEVECLALCDKAPLVQIGTTYYTNMNVNELATVLDKLE